MSDAPARWWPAAVLDRSRWGTLVEPVLGRIAAARNRGRFPHGLLLTGSPGLGRELAAVEAAVMLVCDGADQAWSVSSSADRVRGGNHPDVVAMMPEGKAGIIKIDPIREQVVEVVGSRPYEGLRRVWIFDAVEAEHLPGPSANAFLKTLEEPPEHAVFILLAANPSAVLPTIRSRCQQLALPSPSVVASDAVGAGVPPELSAMALGGVKVAPILVDIRAALEEAAAGESRHLLRLPYVIGDKVSAFEVVAAVAAEMATEVGRVDAAEGLARLAADLLTTERRSRALNLNADRQLVSCLLRWFREI
jgi:DNA polymerase-3 subunit delta'